MVMWQRTIQIAREETHCCHVWAIFLLASRVLLYAPSHRPDSTYHSFCYTSHGAPVGKRKNSMDKPWGINSMTHCTTSRRFTMELDIYDAVNTFLLMVTFDSGIFLWEKKSWWLTDGAISRSCQCSTTGINKACCMCYPVCGMMLIKDAILLIKKNCPWSGSSGHPHSLCEWSFAICLMPNNHKHNTLSVSLNKTILQFLS